MATPVVTPTAPSANSASTASMGGVPHLQKLVASAEAPSNIALIKYMGKAGIGNVPANGSVSFSLQNLRSRVEIFQAESSDSLFSLDKDTFEVFLSKESGERYLKHFTFLKKQLGMEDFFSIYSGNNFPSDCGVASSASSFAALTLAAVSLARSHGKQVDFSQTVAWSRQGSGSSCRSLLNGWVYWSEDGSVTNLQSKWAKLNHFVITDSQKKLVSSSEAHRRVVSSPLFAGRPARANQRLTELLRVLQNGTWLEFYQIAWVEFMDMHELFHTSQEKFSYMNENTKIILDFLQVFWQDYGDGPVVTMDAGSSIHLLFRNDQNDLQNKLLAQLNGEIKNKLSSDIKAFSGSNV